MTMTDPFKDTTSPFEPFFTESVSIHAQRDDGKTMNQTIPCSVFDDVEADPMSQDMVESDIRQIQFLGRQMDWAFLEKLRIGDELRFASQPDKKYAVSSVKHDNAMGIIVAAREV